MEFRSNNNAISKLYMSKYIYYCQRKLLEYNQDFINIVDISKKFIQNSLILFNKFNEKKESYQESIWIYNHSLDIAKFLQEKSKGNY